MKLSKKDKPALILIDIQKAFDDISYWGGGRNNPDAEANAAKLLHFWRKNNLPVFHVKHCSSNPNSLLAEGNKGNEIKDIVQPLPGEPLIKKNVNSAFIGTDLKDQLDRVAISKLIIAGLTTDHCVSTSVRMAGNLGFDTYVVGDATATFDKIGVDGIRYTAETLHQANLASLNGEFATVVNTKEVIENLKN